MLTFFTKIITLFLAAVRWAFIIIMFLSILGLIVPYLSDASSYSYLHRAISWEASINEFIKEYIPTKIAGFDLSRLLTIVACLVVIDTTKSFSEKIRFISQRRRIMNELQHIQQSYKSPSKQNKIAELESKMQQANMSNGKNRQELLKEFATIKRELEKIGRDLAFLAIDVVDSTGMKIGEDPAIIEHDFHEYRNYIEAKFKEHGFIKASWTPDGVMACFNSIENAVQAAQDILQGLDYFNRHVKSMKRDFVLRCGVNGGRVYYDDSIPLEQFSDRTIDIAGHMQKYAPPNSILIAKHAIEPVSNRDNFVTTKRLVDGLEVCEWLKVDTVTANDSNTAKAETRTGH